MTFVILVGFVIVPVNTIEVGSHHPDGRTYQYSCVPQDLLVVSMKDLTEHVERELELVILAIRRGRDTEAELGIEAADDLLNRNSGYMVTFVKNDAIPRLEELADDLWGVSVVFQRPPDRLH